MEFKEKIAIERKIKKDWDEIKEHEETLSEILMCKKEVEAFDYILFLQCANIVLEYIEFHKGTLEKIPKRIEGGLNPEGLSLLKDAKEILKNLPKHLTDQISREVEYYAKSADESVPVNERLEAVDSIRNLSWRQLYTKKSKVVSLCDRFPDPGEMNEDDYMLVFKCMSMVILELSMKDMEVNILESLKFE